MKKIKVIISGGGTGGHIYPAIAIANALKDQGITQEIYFVGALGRMEMQKVPAAGYPIIGLWISGIQRKRLLKNFLLPIKLIASLWKAKRIIRTFQPDIVIGTGGYASAPILYMAARRNIPTLIQEQNAFPGLTNKLLGKHVHRICVAHPHMEQYFPPEKIILTGNPVRKDINATTQREQTASTYFGLDPDKKCLLILGGSLGATTINKSILHAIHELTNRSIQVIWQTGRLHFEQIHSHLTKQQKTYIKCYSFLEKIDLAYAAADVVISRAGALAISELCLARKAVIFIPSPNVTADHQTKNVAHLVANKAALMIKDQKAQQQLIPTALQLLKDEKQQRDLAKNIALLARPQATETIVAAIKQLAHKKSPEKN